MSPSCVVSAANFSLEGIDISLAVEVVDVQRFARGTRGLWLAGYVVDGRSRTQWPNRLDVGVER
jgi:hypothetical protein